MIANVLHRFERFAPHKIGAVVLMLLLLVGVALFKKTELMTAVTPGDDVKVSFARDYHLRSYVTKVKIAGVRVGLVTDVEHQDGGTTIATVHIDKSAAERLGESPSAAIRPTTLLGGNYYIELEPGGSSGTPRAIPASRTTIPVELDRVLETLQPRARVGLQRIVTELDGSLGRRGSRALRNLVTAAPATLRPLGQTLAAMRGEDPSDIGGLVTSLEHTADVLSQQRHDVDTSVVGLDRVSRALAASAPDVAGTVRNLPSTLRSTRAGLGALSTTLDQLKDVSNDELPTAHQLSRTLTALDPALTHLRPVVRDLRPSLRDLRPTVQSLVPSVISGTTVVNDLKGAPMQRVNGPIVSALNSDWHGTGVYAQGGGDTLMYKEIGQMIAGMDNAGRMTDRNGSTIHFQPGFGVGSVSGTPISFEQLVMRLAYPGGVK